MSVTVDSTISSGSVSRDWIVDSWTGNCAVAILKIRFWRIFCKLESGLSEISVAKFFFFVKLKSKWL